MSLRAELFLPVIAAMETAFNAVLRLDPGSLKKLAAFQGKVIALELQAEQNTPWLTLYILPGEGGVQILGQYAGEPDTVLAGTPLAMAEMSLGPDANRVLFSGDVTIRGDIELGQRFKRVLDELEIDWEEPLSHLTGDIVAHKLGDALRGASTWWQQALNTLERDAAEYLQQESGTLPAHEEVEQFNAEVDVLRNDVERLTARVRRLSENSNG